MNNNLYFKSIGDDCGEEELEEMFSWFGNVTSFKMAVDSDGEKLGYGFVCFSTEVEAERALRNLNGIMLGSKPKPLYLVPAERKEDRRVRKQAYFAQKWSLPPINMPFPYCQYIPVPADGFMGYHFSGAPCWSI